MAKKRIYNPETKSYYSVREPSTERDGNGQIIGRWSSKKR